MGKFETERKVRNVKTASQFQFAFTTKQQNCRIKSEQYS